ncbi:hypothetical protein CR161_02590 [Prosthecochloris sp. ZM]|nr:hypothetical protein CR161_02590 [Prosthecochloris sp. ZM]
MVLIVFMIYVALLSLNLSSLLIVFGLVVIFAVDGFVKKNLLFFGQVGYWFLMLLVLASYFIQLVEVNGLRGANFLVLLDQRFTFYGWDPNFSSLLVFISYLYFKSLAGRYLWLYTIPFLVLFVLLGSRMVLVGYLICVAVDYLNSRFDGVADFLSPFRVFFISLLVYFGLAFYLYSSFGVIGYDVFLYFDEGMDSSFFGRIIGGYKGLIYLVDNLNVLLFGWLGNEYAYHVAQKTHNTYINLMIVSGGVFTFFCVFLVIRALKRLNNEFSNGAIVSFIVMSFYLHSAFHPFYVIPFFFSLRLLYMKGSSIILVEKRDERRLDVISSHANSTL